MIKIRVIRETNDATTVLWIGCLVSELERVFPLGDDTDRGQVADYRFEGFANGAWYRINDPRTESIPASEKELRNSYRGACKHRHTISSDTQTTLG